MDTKVKAVLFDLDGTLINTIKGLTELVNQMRADFGKAPLSEEKVGNYIGKGMLVLVRRSMTDSMDGQLDQSIYELAVSSFNKHVQAGNYNHGEPYPDVSDSIKRLRKAGLKIAVVTNKPYEMTLETLKENGLEGQFDVIVGGDSASQPKPSAAPVLLACEKLSVNTSEAIMIGDSGNDSAAASAAGVPCILVRTGWSEGIPLEKIAERDGACIKKNLTEAIDGIIGTNE